MSCQEVRSLLVLESLEVLEEDEEKLVSKHVASCARCRDEKGQVDAAVALLRSPAAPVAGPATGAREAIWEKVVSDLDARVGAPSAAEPSPAISIVLVCSFCHGAVARREACYCASCLAPHHDECFRSHGRCSALGCEETNTVRPQLEPPRVARPRIGRWALSVGLLAIGGAAGAIAARRPAPPVPAEKPPATETPEPEATPDGVPPESAGPGRDIKEFLDPPKRSWAPPGRFLDTLDIFVEDAELRDVIAEISSRSGKPIFVEPEIHEKVTISLRKIPWRDSVQVLAQLCKCEVAPLGSESLIVTQPASVTIQFQNANVNTVIQLLAAYSGENIIVAPDCPSVALNVDLRTVHWFKALQSILKTYDVHAVAVGSVIVILPGPGPELTLDEVPQPRTWRFEAAPDEPNGRYDCSVEHADLRDLMDEIGRRVGRNIIVEPEIQEKVTCELHQVPWHDLVLAMAYMTHCRIEKRGQLYVFTQPPKVTLQASDTPVALWLQTVAAYAGKNVVVAPDVKGTITLDLHEVDWMEAIRASALAADLEVHEDAGQILRICAAKKPRRR